MPDCVIGMLRHSAEPHKAGHVCKQVQAEKAAWALAREAGLDLVAINPSLVLGPVLSSQGDSTSIQMMKVGHPSFCIRRSLGGLVHA